MQRWDCNQNKKVDAPDIDGFLTEIVAFCRKHNMCIGHEDGFGAFEVYRTCTPGTIDWLYGANIGINWEEESPSVTVTESSPSTSPPSRDTK